MRLGRLALALALYAPPVLAQRISDMPAASAIGPADQVPILQDGVNKRVTVPSLLSGKQPVNGDSSGQHVTPPGSAASPTLAAAINGSCIRVDLYGADPTGTVNSDAAVTAALAVVGTGSGCVQFGPGLYKFASQIAAATAAATKNTIAVYGAGSGATKLYWPGAGGGLVFALNSDRSSFHVQGVSLITGQPGGAEAIRATNSVCLGDWVHSRVEDVTIEGDGYGLPSGGNKSNYWTTGLHTTAVSGLITRSLTIYGSPAPFGGSPAGNGNGIQFEGAAPTAAYPTGCYAVVNDNSIFRMLGGMIGYVYGGYAQGVTITQSNFEYSQVGISIPAGTVNADELNVSDSQFDCFQNGIGVASANAVHGNFHNNLFYIANNSNGIAISGGQAYSMNNNIFSSDPVYYGSATGIRVVSNAAANKSIIGAGNVFSNMVTGVQLDTASSGWSVQSNVYGGVTNTVVNNGTGNTIGGGSP